MSQINVLPGANFIIALGAMIMLGEKLKNLRNDKDLTQEQVAKYLGLTRGAYAGYELGRRDPDKQTLLKLARFYGVSVDFLIDDSIKKP